MAWKLPEVISNIIEGSTRATKGFFESFASQEGEEVESVTATAQAAAEAAANAGLALKAPLASPALTGTPTAPTPPKGTNSTQLATMAAVQSAAAEAISGLTAHANVVYATVAALPTNVYLTGVLTGSSLGALTVDGEAVTVGQRLLVKNEAGEANNGIYVVTHAGGVAEAYVLTRATDMKESSQVEKAYTFVEGGKTLKNSGWFVATPGPFTLGTTPIPWGRLPGSGDLVPGEGITIDGNVVAVSSSVASGSSVGAGYNGLVWNSTSKTWEQANVLLRRGLATEPTSAVATYTLYPREYGATEAESGADAAFQSMFDHIQELAEAGSNPIFTFTIPLEQYAYYFAAALRTDRQGNCQVALPKYVSGGKQINIKIIGNGGNSHLVSRLEGASYSAEHGVPSMWGGPTGEQLGFTNAEFANVFLELYNITCNLPANPSLFAMDLERIAALKMDRIAVRSSSGESEEPTHPCGGGMRLPESDNDGMVEIGYYEAQRLYVGMVANCAHLRANNIYNRNCVLALGMTGNEQYGGNDGHAAWIDYLQTVESIYHLAGWNGSEGAVSVPEGHRVKLCGGNWDMEEQNESLHPNWFDTKDHLLDANSQFFGGFNWTNRVRGQVGGVPLPLKKVGGLNFTTGVDLSAEKSTAVQNTGTFSFASGAITLSAIPGEAVTAKEPATLAASPEEGGEIKHVYVTNFGANTISRYSRNGTTGALTLLGTTATGSKPRGIAISPNGKYVYVSYYGEAKIGCFERNTTTGELTAISGHETIATGTSPYQIIVDPKGETVYVVAEKEEGGKWYVWQYKIEAGGSLAGLATPKVETGSNPTHLAITESSKYVYIVAQGAETGKYYVWQYEREAGGGLKALGTKKVEVAGKCTGIACAGSASVYATGFTAERLYQWKIGAGGALEALAPEYVATAKEPFAVAVTPDGKNVYVTNAAANTLGIYERNTGTGKLTAASPASVETGKEPQSVITAGNSTVYTTNYASSSQTVGQYLRHLSIEVSDPGTTATSQIYYSQGPNVIGPVRTSSRTAGTGFTPTTATPSDSGEVGWFRVG